MALEFVADGLT